MLALLFKMFSFHTQTLTKKKKGLSKIFMSIFLSVQIQKEKERKLKAFFQISKLFLCDSYSGKRT